MVSTLQSSVVIECPHCGTRYQLAADAIGAKGRRVACAHCGKSWKAVATAMPEPAGDDDQLFDAKAEEALDEVFAAEERAVAEDRKAVSAPPATEISEGHARTIAEIKAAIMPRPRPASASPDAAAQRKRLSAFEQRQAAVGRQLPMARVRRIVRVVAVGALALIIVCGVAFRAEVVRQVPDLAGVYEALGMGVNIVGLEFRDVRTLTTLRGGSRVMQVDARIYSVAASNIAVPQVVVTVLDAAGTPLYEWSVTPAVSRLDPGEIVDFSTQLSAPPSGAARVRLTFTNGNGRAESPVAATTDD